MLIYRFLHPLYPSIVPHYLLSPPLTSKDIKLRPSNKPSPHLHTSPKHVNHSRLSKAAKVGITFISNPAAFQTRRPVFLPLALRYTAQHVKAYLYLKNPMHVQNVYVAYVKLALMFLWLNKGHGGNAHAVPP